MAGPHGPATMEDHQDDGNTDFQKLRLQARYYK
jgi:hypothetical protein